MSKYSVYSGSAVGTNYDTVILTEGRTTEAFASGEVAYLLREGCTVNETTWSGDVWGQNVDKAMPFDAYPVFSGDTVYRLSNGEGVTLGYSNDENKVIFCMDIVWGEPVFTYTDEEGWDNPETSTVTVKNTGNG